MSFANIEYSSANKVEVRQSRRRTLMKKVVVALAASAVVSACASSQQQVDLHAPALNSWVGAPVEEFLDMHGTPTTVIDKVNYQIYRFDACKTKRINHSSKRCEPTTSPHEQKRCETYYKYWYTVTYACTYELVVVESVINDWSMNGNNCKMVTVSYRPS